MSAHPGTVFTGIRYRNWSVDQWDQLPAEFQLSFLVRQAMRMVAMVFPARTNAYIVDQLIDWSRVPDDPLFQLTFPQPEMLDAQDLETLLRLQKTGAPQTTLREAIQQIRQRFNPHPGEHLLSTSHRVLSFSSYS